MSDGRDERRDAPAAAQRLVRDLTRFAEHRLHEHPSLEAFLDEEPSDGIASIAYGDGLLDVLYIDRGAATTIVFLHAAVPLATSTMPVFNGLGVAASLDANVLSVSDPSLTSGVRLGWHAGSRSQPLQHDLVAVITHYLRHRAQPQHLVFFGASGGGFASIFFSSAFPDSLAVAVNPQTSIGRYYRRQVQDYARAAWGVDSIDGVDALTDLRGIVPMRSTIAYLQANRDHHHLDRHMRPWMTSLGVSDRERVWAMLGDWGDGHVPPPPSLTKQLLATLVGADGRWPSALERLGFVRADDPDLQLVGADPLADPPGHASR